MRYTVGNYVTTDSAAAKSRSVARGKPIAEADVELVHRSVGFCLWSDGEVTTAYGMPKEAQASSLSEPAVKLISLPEGYLNPTSGQTRLR
jgi:hypothetical protein